VYPSYPPACTQCPPNGQRNAEYGFTGTPSNATWCVGARKRGCGGGGGGAR